MQVPQEDSLASTDTEAAKVAASAMARSRRKGREVFLFWEPRMTYRNKEEFTNYTTVSVTVIK